MKRGIPTVGLRAELRAAAHRVREQLATDAVRQGRGAALLIVLVAIALMGAFTTEFVYNTRVSLRVASNLQQDVQAYYHARSSVQIARMVLRSRQALMSGGGLVGAAAGKIGGNIELWAHACKFVEIYNTGKINLFGKEVIDISERDGIGVSKGGFECLADAEDGRVNINNVEADNRGGAGDQSGMVFNTIFSYLQGPRPAGTGLSRIDKEKAELVLNIMDWADGDSYRRDFDPSGAMVQGSGAGEDQAYTKYDYEPKNAKYDSTEEVRLVDGMDDETWCKLRDKLTVYSTEKLNVNAASIELLAAIICQSLPEEAQAPICLLPNVVTGLPPIYQIANQLEQCRGLRRTLLLKPFKNSNAFFQMVNTIGTALGFPINMNARSESGKFLGTQGRIIRIVGTGNVGRSSKKITAIVDTTTGKYVYWRED